MRAALKSKAQARQQIAISHTLAAPVGGWNARDALAEMPETDAIALDNWMPKASFCELRGGSISHVQQLAIDLLTEDGSILMTETNVWLTTEDTVAAISGTVKTLPVYNGMTGVNRMFAITEDGVYDVSTAGAPGPLLIARTNGKHQTEQFGDGTTNWLIAMNGVDDPLYYNGTTWQTVDETTSPALTGFTGNAVERFIYVNSFKRRLFFIPTASLSFWYLPPAVAGGALVEFNLASECPRGGYLMAMGTWTRDAGDGQDDVAVFITSEGEAILYQGNNPSSATAWSKIGSFYVGRPLGRRCLTQYGGDLLVLTENGVFPLSAALPTANIDYKYALSNKIERAFTESARAASGVFGWESTVYPSQQAMLVNVPIAEDGIHYQYVMNTQTKSWCRFLAWDAETFAVFNENLYFARGNGVFHAWTGSGDETVNIAWYAKQAFTNFKSGQLKSMSLYRPILSVNGALNYLTDIDVDFQDELMTGALTAAATTGTAIWNQSQWNQARWSGGLKVVKPWTSIGEWPGIWIAGKIKGATNARSIQWMASDYVYTEGGIL